MNHPNPHATIEARAAAWLAQRDGRRWTDDDERRLTAWLDESTAHRVAWLRLQAAWQRADQMQALPAEPDDDDPTMSASPTTPPSMVQPRRPARWPAPLGIAAVAVLAAGLVWLAPRAPSGEERYSTPVGGLEAITLADGSRVTLNTRTRARAVINDSERKVWLEEGEAFFEVTPDAARPFVVAAGKDRITVLGTKFSVRHEGGRTQVVVLEGRVRLDQADRASRELQPAPTVVGNNDSAVLQSGGVLVMAKTPEQVQQTLSWRQGRLAFEHMMLGDIAAEFNRYNRRALVVEGEAASLRLGGSFDAHNVEAFARLVHEGFGLKLRTEGDRIHLSAP
jgi:transmembrane sensor